MENIIEQELVSVVRKYQEDITDEQRVDFWREIQKDYCALCGSKYLPCHCTNED